LGVFSRVKEEKLPPIRRERACIHQHVKIRNASRLGSRLLDHYWKPVRSLFSTN